MGLSNSFCCLMDLANSSVGHMHLGPRVSLVLEKEASSGTSYLECFRPSNIRRTEIVCFLMGYSTVFYVAAGLNERNSFTMSLIQYSIGAIGTIFSWFLMSRVGRRTIYLYGLAILFVLLMVIRFVSLAPRSDNVNWTIAAMLSVFTFIYDLTVGPLDILFANNVPARKFATTQVDVVRGTIVA
ncbi:hypothetical protein D6C98_07426 [Aureobasidium pullulans]|nr:hypothetical protein D6C98_07426 [Aureobasidium pullulans]